MTQAEAEFNATGTPARVFKDFRYRTRHSWTSERRVVGKAEFLEKGANPRFVVTSLSPERLGARALYEDFYCARGDMENRIKEQQWDLFADRTSAATMRANQLRLYLSSAAYMLMHGVVRKADPPGSRSVSDDSLEAPGSAPRSVSRSATSGSPCRKPIPTARSSLPSFEKSRPFLCAAEVCPDQTPPKTKSFHRSGRALPECIPSRSSEPEKRSISRPSPPPHHSTWTGSIAKLSENRSGLPKSPSFPKSVIYGAKTDQSKRTKFRLQSPPAHLLTELRQHLTRWGWISKCPGYSSSGRRLGYARGEGWYTCAGVFA